MARAFFVWLVRRRVIVLMLALLLAASGTMSLFRIAVDAFPDVSPVSVTILTEAPGMSPLEVEQQITDTIEPVMNGLPGVRTVRSKTLFGLSSVMVVFNSRTEIYRARTMVTERLGTIKGLLPPGASPVLGAVSTPTGNIFRYTLEGSSDLMSLRTLQDWVVKRALMTTPGVAAVLSYGGYVKSYFVVVDPFRLDAFHLSLRDVTRALALNNSNVGGGTLDRSGEYYLVRGIGRIDNREDILSVVIAERKGVPVLVRDVARVEVRPEVRRGNALLDSRDVVKGTVVMLRGENALRTLSALEKKVAQINRTLLPPGIRIESYYNEAPLIRQSFHTVVRSLVEGGDPGRGRPGPLSRAPLGLPLRCPGPSPVHSPDLPRHAGDPSGRRPDESGGNRHRDRDDGGCLHRHGREHRTERIPLAGALSGGAAGAGGL
jgi:cobalt-zinc-cadmium resistance protein CzcA